MKSFVGLLCVLIATFTYTTGYPTEYDEDDMLLQDFGMERIAVFNFFQIQ